MKGALFLIQYPQLMLILLPVILMLLTALGLLILRMVRPEFKFPWILAAGGATLALASVLLWQINFPHSISLPFQQLGTIFQTVPAWHADGISWTYALALTALATAGIWTSVVRSKNIPMSWAGTLALTALGVLAVTAENPLTLLLAWSAIDLFELIAMLRSTEGEEQIEGVIIAFAVRLVGTGLVIWADMVSVAGGSPLDFHSISPSSGIYLLGAVALRLGVLPLHLPYRKEDVVRRGFGTTLRLVSATASLALLAHIPAVSMKFTLTPYLLILAAIAGLYSGWMWLRSSDEILGRPFWILGLASLSIAEGLLGNPVGSVGWGVALILCGGVLFLFSAHRKNILWLPMLGLWVLSALPFSLTASSWQTGNAISWLFFLPFLPAQALLMAGYLRHIIRPGETSLESQEKWVKIIYPAGLLILIATAFLLGLWGWPGARSAGPWWLAGAAVLLAAGFTILDRRFLFRMPSASISNQWTRIFRLEWVYSILKALYNFLRRIADTITGAFEGEGGLLWTFLFLILILSLLSTQSR
jgi:hypothetical protein